MTLIKYDIEYSIVICACNTDERLLKRCLDAVYNLDIDGIATEVIVVDNSSTVPINNFNYVREFVRKGPSVRIIIVPAQGLKNARIAAIKEARGKYIVYFDSDNEPGENYLQELKKLNEKFPQVAAIGPGHVSVDFIDGIDTQIENYARIAFRERHEAVIKFSGLHDWQSCYPFGTGLCINSLLLKEYINLAREGRFTMSGRTGNQLTNGDDTQMVLLCISKGYFAGVSPTLQVKHIVPEARANHKYLQRLIYGMGLCYQTCLMQVFPEHKEKLQQEIISKSKFIRRILKKYLEVRFSSDPLGIFDLIQFIALNAGAYIALDKPVPAPIKTVVKYLKLN